MGSKRLEKIESQLIREIADILLRKVSDPRLAWVTVTRVSITPDLSLARIFITTLEGGEKRAAALEALKNAESYIRHELGSRLELRLTPQVHFQMDDAQEKVERIYQILEDLKRGGEGQAHG